MLNLLPNSERLTDFLVIAAEQKDTMLVAIVNFLILF